MLRALLDVWHLDVETRLHGRDGVAKAELEVRDEEAVEAPLVAEDPRQQLPMMAAPLAVERVVGAHDARDAALDDAAEVRKVHLVQRALVGNDVELEACVLDRVAGEML